MWLFPSELVPLPQANTGLVERERIFIY